MMLFRPTSDNEKTGNVPTAWVGPDAAAAAETCTGCALYPRACYAWRGRVLASAQGLFRAAARAPEKYTLDYALAHAARSAKMLRVTALGDAGALPAEEVAQIVTKVRAAKLALVGYTHRWREHAAHAWRGHLMASCETPEQADTAVAAGWRATFILKRGEAAVRGKTPAGNPWILCPAQHPVRAGRPAVTCNSCRLCAAASSGPVIAFRGHGPVRLVEAARQRAAQPNL